jgi:hypothetical protein
LFHWRSRAVLHVAPAASNGDGEIVHQLRALLNRDSAQGVRRAIALLHRITDTEIARCGPALADHKEGKFS